MATTKIQHRRLLERAEGYLELAVALDADLALETTTKQRLANRALACLSEIQNPLGHKPYVLFLKGQAYRTAENHAEAVKYFEQSQRIDPDNIHLYFALGWSYKRCDRITDAVEAMKRAVELDSESAIAHYNLACYFALEEQIESALMHLSYAFELDTKYREMAIYETDFDLIRSDPRFMSMTSIVDPV
ncbi:MAG: tetratricopeptide repeat protein [Planctomycetota bacterium]